MKLRTIPCLSASLAAIAGFLPGCHDPAHQAVVQRRVDGMKNTVSVFENMERRRPQNMADTIDVARDQYRHDVEKSRENPHLVGKAIQNEFDRFEDRQPQYRRDIEELLRGDPDNIKRTLPHMIY